MLIECWTIVSDSGPTLNQCVSFTGYGLWHGVRSASPGYVGPPARSLPDSPGRWAKQKRQTEGRARGGTQ